MLPGSSGERLGMLLNTPHSTGSPTTNSPAHKVNAEIEKPYANMPQDPSEGTLICSSNTSHAFPLLPPGDAPHSTNSSC